MSKPSARSRHATFGVIALSLLAATLCAATAAGQALVRVDLSATTGRSDAETPGWQEWEIGSERESTLERDGVVLTLRGIAGGLEGFLHKRGLAQGATLASDGVRTDGAIEIRLEGLPAGRHSIATWHADISGESAPRVQLRSGETLSEAIVSRRPSFGTETATAYVEFEATDGKVCVFHVSSPGSRTVLNALEIDASDPARRARAPHPPDYEQHVDGDAGLVRLSWTGPNDAKEYRVFRGTARSALEARRIVNEMRTPTFQSDQESQGVTVNAEDSLSWHAWRVDCVDHQGQVSRGETWAFRTRHLAFPTAEGYGRFARGGRGGRVLHVTTLADSGPGSLREAVEASGPRTVVFDVSGRIVLETRLAVRNGELTIAGQTAPGKGVCVSNYNLGALGAEDVIIRYIRVRPGDTAGKTLDGMGLASCDHAIIDHCSISWTQDEAFSSRGAQNITLQRTLISEALNVAGHKKYEKGSAHGFAASIGGDIGTFHHNLLAHCAGRNWSLAGGVDQANRHRGRLDIRNNVVFNWDYRTTDGGAAQVQFVNNYYKPGPASRINTYLNPQYENPSFGPQQYYVEGNVVEGVSGPEGPLAPFVGLRVRGSQPEPVTLPEPFFPPCVETQSAEAAFENVLADVGCNAPTLDEHDARVLREVREGRATFRGSVSGKPGLPDSQSDVGGWEDYPEVRRPADWDRDRDGMADAWEARHGLDPSDPTDGVRDSDADGYTNLEEYLNGIVQ